jgi:hypothetical protein
MPGWFAPESVAVFKRNEWPGWPGISIIVHYEDRVTGWSGKPDRIELKLMFYAFSQAERKKSIIYEAKSNIIYSTFFEWGNAKPTALLGQDFEELLRKLLRNEGQ